MNGRFHSRLRPVSPIPPGLSRTACLEQVLGAQITSKPQKSFVAYGQLLSFVGVSRTSGARKLGCAIIRTALNE